jgi:DNA-binding NtrC family response regulator
MDGITLASHIKALSPYTPVVLMTGCGREEVMEKVSGNHVDHIFFKPFRLTEINEVITKMITPIDRGENGYHIDRGRSAPPSRTVPRGNVG